MLVAALHLGDAHTATQLAVFELFEGLAEHDVDIGRQLADPVNAGILSWVVRAGAWPCLIP